MSKVWFVPIVLLLVLACAPGTAVPEPPAVDQQAATPLQQHMQDLYGKARPEGKAVHYTANPHLLKEVKPAFERRFPGISVELVTMPGGAEMATRIEAEYASGQHLADVIDAGGTSIKAQAKAGRLVQWDFLEEDELRPAARESGGRHWNFRINVQGMVVNKTMVPPDKMPKKYQDLLDPFWKGKLLLDDPRVQGAGHGFMVIANRQYGRSFLERLAAQSPTFIRDRNNGPPMVARGETAAFAPFRIDASIADLKANAPVEILFLQDGTTGGGVSAGVLTKAPHPNAGMLWVNYLLSDEGQRNLVTGGQTYGYRKNAPDPKDFPSLAKFDILDLTEEEQERLPEFIKLFEEVFFRR